MPAGGEWDANGLFTEPETTHMDDGRHSKHASEKKKHAFYKTNRP